MIALRNYGNAKEGEMEDVVEQSSRSGVQSFPEIEN